MCEQQHNNELILLSNLNTLLLFSITSSALSYNYHYFSPYIHFYINKKSAVDSTTLSIFKYEFALHVKK